MGIGDIIRELTAKSRIEHVSTNGNKECKSVYLFVHLKD